jgi:MiaB/RimO family radical SAM methylthiotransferase
MRHAVRDGAKEIWLTAQDCGCYGFDIDTDLAELLEELLRLEGDFRIRIGMMNPDHLMKIKNKLFEAMDNPKMFKFLHLCVQAGSNRILEAMNRNYKAEEFISLVKQFREKFPFSTFSTDIIVGFPGENDRDYWDTLDVVRKVSPDVLNINRFWARPRTPAAKLKKRVPSEEIKRRSRVLTEIFHNIAKMQNEKWIGWKGEILIDEKGKNEDDWIGRNEGYKQVIVKGDLKLGDQPQVKIEKITSFDLRGIIQTPGIYIDSAKL